MNGQSEDSIFGLVYIKMAFPPTKESDRTLGGLVNMWEALELKSPPVPFIAFFHTYRQLHKIFSLRSIPPLCNKLDSEEQIKMQVASRCTSARSAEAVTDSFLRHMRTRKARITGLRAREFYLLNDNLPIPMLEWTESDAVEGLALFKVDEKSGVCSFLMHYGPRTSEHFTPVHNYALTWNVLNIQHLKTLFGASQSMLGVLEWSAEDILNLYCRSNLPEASKET
jgi:hypothetical protein